MIPLPALPDDDETIDLLKKQLAIVDRMLAMFDEHEQKHGPLKSPLTHLYDIEVIRRLGNVGWFDPPITEKEIEDDARKYGISKKEAEAELRRLRRES